MTTKLRKGTTPNPNPAPEAPAPAAPATVSEAPGLADLAGLAEVVAQAANPVDVWTAQAAEAAQAAHATGEAQAALPVMPARSGSGQGVKLAALARGLGLAEAAGVALRGASAETQAEAQALFARVCSAAVTAKAWTVGVGPDLSIGLVPVASEVKSAVKRAEDKATAEVESEFGTERAHAETERSHARAALVEAQAAMLAALALPTEDATREHAVSEAAKAVASAEVFLARAEAQGRARYAVRVRDAQAEARAACFARIGKSAVSTAEAAEAALGLAAGAMFAALGERVRAEYRSARRKMPEEVKAAVKTLTA